VNAPHDDGSPVAVIADVHGNRWALEAVLEDIARRGAGRVLNLGDSLYGPLDPAGTAELFRQVDAVSVRGNQDRVLLETPSYAAQSPTFRFVVEQLAPRDIDWLGAHEPAPHRLGPLLLCHGTLERDDLYLAEQVTEHGVVLRAAAALARELADAADAVPSADATVEVILCGHSHVPRVLSLPDRRLLVNPGSVGLPAYTDDDPYPHAMEAGSPHTRYAWLHRTDRGWRTEHVALPYDWDQAAAAAERNGRPDWAAWLRSGRATP
jgi:predicted phosphodiesterase